MSIAAVAVGVLAFVIYVASPVLTSFDSQFSIHIALSLVNEGDLDVTEYYAIVERGHPPPANPLVLQRVGEEYVSRYPYGAPLLAAPLVFLIERVPALKAYAMPQSVFVAHPAGTERLIASAFVATAAAVMVHLAYAVTRDRLVSGGVGLLFAFATSAWSVVTRALWSHGPSILLLSIALLLAVKSHRRERLAVWMAIPLGLALVVRPTNAVPIAVLTGWVALHRRRQLLPFLAIGGILGVAFAMTNAATYGSVLPRYYAASRLSPLPSIDALAGNLVSPARGLLVFSPFLLVIGLSVQQVMRDRAPRALFWPAAAIVLGHWLTISAFWHWWGGHSYGPRLFSDALPFLMFMTLPGLQALRRERGPWWTAAGVAFGAAVLMSVLIHWHGATDSATVAWNADPVNIDEAPERLWDWGDAQFLRGLGK